MYVSHYAGSTVYGTYTKRETIELFYFFFFICVKLVHWNKVVNQLYDPEVQNPAGFIGSNVLIKCNVPTFVKDYVSVTSWLQEPSFNIYPSMESGELIVSTQLIWNACIPMIFRKPCESAACCMYERQISRISKIRWSAQTQTKVRVLISPPSYRHHLTFIRITSKQ